MSFMRVALCVALCAASASANAGSFTLTPRQLQVRSPGVLVGGAPPGYLTVGFIGDGTSIAAEATYRYDPRYFTVAATPLAAGAFCDVSPTRGTFRTTVLTWDNSPLSQWGQPACRYAISAKRAAPLGRYSLATDYLGCYDANYGPVWCLADDGTSMLWVTP